jgi:hypothetical protein
MSQLEALMGKDVLELGVHLKHPAKRAPPRMLQRLNFGFPGLVGARTAVAAYTSNVNQVTRVTSNKFAYRFFTNIHFHMSCRAGGSHKLNM